MDWFAFLLMDVAGWLDRDVWTLRQVDWSRSLVGRCQPMDYETWCAYYHDGWKPGRYV